MNITQGKRPNWLLVIRAQFLIGIVFPLVIGTVVAKILSGAFWIWNFIFVLIIGVGLHLSLDVYNDIYDTLQGSDTPSSKTRNLMSGGSGFLLQHPEALPQFYRIAHLGLLISFFGMIMLIIFGTPQVFWPYILLIYVIAAFLSKYYTAEPVKLGYRGFGEIVLWLSFGPMAIFLTSMTQNIGYHPLFLAVMPISGFSTLTILWVGELIDFKDDQKAGKQGLVIRLGRRWAIIGYLIIQFSIIVNVLLLSVFAFHAGWLLLFSLLPYGILLPIIIGQLWKYNDNPRQLLPAGRWNAVLYGTFNLVFILGLLLIIAVGRS